MSDDDLVSALAGLGAGLILETGLDSWTEAQAHLIKPGLIAIYHLDPEDQPSLIPFDSTEKNGTAVQLNRKTHPPVLLWPMHGMISPTTKAVAQSVQVPRDFALLQFSNVAEELE